MEIIGDLVKIIVPAAVVLYGMFLAVQAFLNKQLEEKKIELKGRLMDVTIPLRLQAYERLLLFLERISPAQLLVRLQPQSVQVSDFLQILLSEIREEYNHNLAQQLYVSHESWEALSAAKDEVTALIQRAAGEVPADAAAFELSKKVMEQSLHLKESLTLAAIKRLKVEARELFT